MNLAVYCRFSSDLQREESIDAQLRIVHDWANRNGHIIVSKYCDKALTGTNDDRPQFQQMIKDIASNIWDGVVVHKIDRFSRNKYDNVFYKKKLKDANKKFFSVAENIDDSPVSIVTESLLEGLSEYYIANLRTEVRKGLNENAYNCKFNGGIPPLGYDVDKKTQQYIVNESEAYIVKEAVRLYFAGYGLLKMALELNRRGFRTKRGNKFTKNSLYDILGNERYTGVYIYNQSINSNKRVKNDKIIKIEGGMPAIISKEDFNKIMEKRVKNKRTSGAYSAKREYALSGLIVCGLCGKKYTGNTTTRKRTTKIYNTSWYMCSGKNKINNCENKNIKCDEIESKVYDLIKEKILNESNIEDILKLVQQEYDKKYSNADKDILSLKREINILENLINNYVKAVGEGLYSEKLKTDLMNAEENKKVLISELEKIEEMKNHKTLDKKGLVAVLNKDFNELKSNKSDLFHKWIREIKITPTKAEVNFTVFDSVVDLYGGD